MVPRMTDEQKCGSCGLPMHPSDPKRYAGQFISHEHTRCITLLLYRNADLTIERDAAQDKLDDALRTIDKAAVHAADLQSRLGAALDLLRESAPVTWCLHHDTDGAHQWEIKAEKLLDGVVENQMPFITREDIEKAALEPLPYDGRGMVVVERQT